MAFDWGYFFSLFSIGAFWQACVTVIVVSTLLLSKLYFLISAAYLPLAFSVVRVALIASASSVLPLRSPRRRRLSSIRAAVAWR
jgi:uncharacterized membrane protein YjjP (DUF1212 family)